jgi:uracil DNA glycosylase
VDPDDVRVIILDEAPSEITADGLAYSCSDAPPAGSSFTNSKTLQTILEVVRSTVTGANRSHDWITQETLDSGERPLLSLLHWAKQGVLLWNTIATARLDRQGNYFTVKRESHWNLSGGSWQHFTYVLIHSLTQHLAQKNKSVGFMLFGNRAKALVHNRANSIKTNPEWVTSHPAPRTCAEGFVGTDCFLLCNQWLEESGQNAIVW